MGWYIVITEEIRATGLAGNTLLVYAAVAGYSRNGNGLYSGGSKPLAEALDLPDRSIRRILAKLLEDGLLEMTTIVVDGQPRRAYRIAGGGQNDRTPGQNDRTPGHFVPPIPPIPPIPPAPPIPPIPPITQDIYTPVGVNTPTAPNAGAGVREGDASRKKFTVPSLSEVRDYWAAAGLKRNPDEFYDHFEANGWKVGGTTPMKDWRAAARNWARREEYRRPAPAKQETFLDAARRTAQRLGIAPEAYTTKTPDYDEQ